MSSRAHVVTPAELSALRDLELLTRTTVEGLRQGLHRSPFHGYNAEFSQYRHYRPGDDLKYVDWKAYGRTDRLYSRQFRETTNMGALFVVDISRSMAYPVSEDPGSRRQPSKLERARATAAILATLVIDQGDAAGVLAVGSAATTASTYVPPRSGRHHLHLCLATLARLTAQGSEPVASALRRAAALFTRRGVIVVLSDFYDDELALVEIRRLARIGHDVVVVHVIAGAELELPRGGDVEFEDLETGTRIVTSPDAIRARYANAVRVFHARVERAVVSEGLGYLRLSTDDPLDAALRRFLIGRRGGG